MHVLFSLLTSAFGLIDISFWPTSDKVFKYFIDRFNDTANLNVRSSFRMASVDYLNGHFYTIKKQH